MLYKLSFDGYIISIWHWMFTITFGCICIQNSDIVCIYIQYQKVTWKGEGIMQEIRSINIKTKNLNDMIAKIKAGLPAETVDTLSASLDLPLKTIAQIVDIAESTLARRRKKKGKLKADESDRIVRIARLRDRAVDVFEDEQQANRWLKTPLRALGDYAPLEYAESELGAQEVMNLLGRIEHGVYS